MLFISITLHDRRDYLDATFCAVSQRKIRGCTWRDFTVISPGWISRLIENWGWLANEYVVFVSIFCTIAEPWYNEVLVVTNDLLHSSYGTYYGKELHVTNHRYSKHILPVSWSFVSERTFSLTFPSMPTPASAAWIILTSFPPSPKIKLRQNTNHWRETMAWKPLYLGAHISLRRSDFTTTRSELMHTRSRHVVREWAVGAASNCIMGLFWRTNFHAVSCATTH